MEGKQTVRIEVRPDEALECDIYGDLKKNLSMIPF